MIYDEYINRMELQLNT
jgi:alpha-glucosidase